MSGTRLRRSNRAPKKLEDSLFVVGEKVEVQRNGETVVATLTQNLTEGTASPHPRWLIRFDKAGYKDEEVYEHALTKILSASNSSRNTSRNPSPVIESAKSSPKEAAEAADDQVSSEDSAKVSAREARSKRRQAKIEEQPKQKKKKQKVEEKDCTKIKLLTGTLYIYRGRNPRAEFVRRV